MKVRVVQTTLGSLIQKYEESFKHAVPGYALRSYPDLHTALETALQQNKPIQSFKDHVVHPEVTDEISSPALSSEPDAVNH